MVLMNWDEISMVISEDDWLEVKWLVYVIYDIVFLKFIKKWIV